jgi:hypothetical protein
MPAARQISGGEALWRGRNDMTGFQPFRTY